MPPARKVKQSKVEDVEDSGSEEIVVKATVKTKTAKQVASKSKNKKKEKIIEQEEQQDQEEEEEDQEEEEEEVAKVSSASKSKKKAAKEKISKKSAATNKDQSESSVDEPLLGPLSDLALDEQQDNRSNGSRNNSFAFSGMNQTSNADNGSVDGDIRTMTIKDILVHLIIRGSKESNPTLRHGADNLLTQLTSGTGGFEQGSYANNKNGRGGRRGGGHVGGGGGDNDSNRGGNKNRRGGANHSIGQGTPKKAKIDSSISHLY